MCLFQSHAVIAGKLDETKLTDGRLLLAATMNTRGWSMEDRVHATVEAMENERGTCICIDRGTMRARGHVPPHFFQ